MVRVEGLIPLCLQRHCPSRCPRRFGVSFLKQNLVPLFGSGLVTVRYSDFADHLAVLCGDFHGCESAGVRFDQRLPIAILLRYIRSQSG